MGLYDQLLGLNQQGLDQGTQIAMQRAAQPTMADVFMDRFRAGGQDQLARQKAEEQSRMHDATVKNMETQRLLQAGTLGSVYATPDNADFLKSVMSKIPGLEDASLNFQGSNERKIVSSEQMQAERLRQQMEMAKAKNLIDELKAKNAGLKPTSDLGKLAFDRQNGLISSDQAASRERALNTRFNPVTTSLANQGLKAEGSGVPEKVVPIEAGKADVERKTKAAEIASGWTAATTDVDELVKKIDEVLKDPSALDDVTGVKGKLFRMSPTTSRGKTTSALIDSIKAQAGLQKIADLKKSGAGLGQVTEGEHKLVQNGARSVDYEALDSGTLANNLRQLKANAQKLKTSLYRDASAKTEAVTPSSGPALSLEDYLKSKGL